MSPMEQALRDEIAWLTKTIRLLDQNLSNTISVERNSLIDRLAALTAALPAPGDAGDWVMVPRVATREMLNDGSGALNEPVWMEEMAKAWDAMIEIAPHPPVSLGEISQAQAQAMREALVAHNDLLRSAFQAVQRDAIHDTAGTTNFRLLADRLGETLNKHHAAANEARAALSASPLPAAATPGGPDA